MPIDFEKLFECSPNPYMVLDESLAYVWMNDAYLRATMSTREYLVGKNVFDAFPSDPASDSYQLLHGSFARVLATGEMDELALIRYDIRNQQGGLDTLYWSATHTPFTGDDGSRYILQHTVDVTELHNLRTMRDDMGLVKRAGAVQARNRDLSAQTERLNRMFEQAPGFLAVLTGPLHRFELANQAYLSLIGQRDVIGMSVAEALPEVVKQGFVELLDNVRSSGEAYVGRKERILLDNSGSGKPTELYLDFIYQPITEVDGSVSGILVQGHDVTEQVEAQERQELMIYELNHRVKNTLAIVRALASQSFRSVAGSEVAVGAFDARLNALAAAHSLLVEQSWQEADLGATVIGAIEAAVGEGIGRCHISGPEFGLSAQSTLALAMLVHELSTNALKYGALSAQNGRVDVNWALEEKEASRDVTLCWVERDGPPVTEPKCRGLGTRLISRGIAAELGNNATLDFAPEGLLCTITASFPVTGS